MMTTSARTMRYRVCAVAEGPVWESEQVRVGTSIAPEML